MNEKLRTALFCLVFAVAFGGVGAGASWLIGTMLYDGSRAAEWVKVRATADAPSSYRYTFEGREYHGTRLGLEPLGATDNLDNWHEVMADRFATAMAEKKPITVFVNPDKPDEALVDREIRWKLVMFMSVFALAFGGVGLGALYFAGHAVFSKAESAEGRNAPKPANEGVFARGMISDAPASGGAAGVIDTMDDGTPAAPDPMMAELEKLSGRKLGAEQREQLEKMSPRSRAMVTKVAGWLGKIKQAND